MAFFDLPLAQLRDYRPALDQPDDFDAFWSRTLTAARKHDLAAEVTPYDALLPGVRVSDVRFSGYDGQRVAAWLVEPAIGDRPLPCVVQFIGYGGGRGRPHEWLLWPAAGYAVLVVDSRGQGDGDTPDLPGDNTPHHNGLMTRGVLDPETYYYRRLFTDAVRAVDLASTLPAVDPGRIVVAGASQGGGIAQAVAGLHRQVRAALIDVPFLTCFRRATEITDSYPYQELSNFCAANRDRVEQVFHTLGYFDGGHFAARATAPALYSVGLMDDVCPPSTVFAAYNHYAGPKRMQVWPYNRHEGGGSFQTPVQLPWLRDQLA
ncbi:cephalosporin-C deacetylase [Acrocarpospora phusangensis]|uniref:Cephalosporin-C deacetylase n=1 Tax=Acrocarpospora phusangensis TaxID=1070424 RepID=A0A919UJU6_9ACTN|nr:alpha/beta fold hydrolase [Acrocarpospora phusangensis]GIH24394.1 cephalosporin-C deacetylase [Acrocarpospora phusangensis]